MTDIIARQPDDSSYDEILRELAYARMIQRGLDDSANGRTVTDDDIKRKIDAWRNNMDNGGSRLPRTNS